VPNPTLLLPAPTITVPPASLPVCTGCGERDVPIEATVACALCGHRMCDLCAPTCINPGHDDEPGMPAHHGRDVCPGCYDTANCLSTGAASVYDDVSYAYAIDLEV
jgi:hypothetical protein